MCLLVNCNLEFKRFKRATINKRHFQACLPYVCFVYIFACSYERIAKMRTFARTERTIEKNKRELVVFLPVWPNYWWQTLKGIHRNWKREEGGGGKIGTWNYLKSKQTKLFAYVRWRISKQQLLRMRPLWLCNFEAPYFVISI